jgi:chromosome segregation ATPase
MRKWSTDMSDFHELISLLEQHPEWRAELRRLILTEELLTVPETVSQLVEAQKRTDEQIRQLTEAQRQTTEQIRQLTARVDDLTVRLEQLTARVDDLTVRLEQLTARWTT